MTKFNVEKFCKDLIDLRGDELQNDFAKNLEINRSTLSLLENGKQIPNIDFLTRICDLSHKAIEDYFVESTRDSLIYMVRSLVEEDRSKIEEMTERIQIREKYELLAKRCSNVIN